MRKMVVLLAVLRGGDRATHRGRRKAIGRKRHNLVVFDGGEGLATLQGTGSEGPRVPHPLKEKIKWRGPPGLEVRKWTHRRPCGHQMG